MATITEDYVSFETANLLKEKGFNEECSRWYVANEPQEGVVEKGFGENQFYINAPTLQMAIKWLREVHNIYINVQPDFPSEKDYKMCWCWSVNILHKNCVSTKRHQCYIETYEEAVEAALKHCLEYLLWNGSY